MDIYRENYIYLKGGDYILCFLIIFDYDYLVLYFQRLTLYR